MNPFDKRNFIKPMGSAIVLSGCVGFFPFKFWVYGCEVGGEVFFFKLYLVRRVDCTVSTWTLDLPCKFYLGRPGAREGHCSQRQLPLWEMESRWTLETSETNLRGQISMACDALYINGKPLKRRCLKWARIAHLDI